MKKLMLWMVVVACLGVMGCAAQQRTLGQKPIPTAQEIANAYYGDAPKPENYEQIVKDFQAKRLNDPYSAVYVFDGPPKKGYVTYWLLGPHSWVTQYGYCGQTSLNARNRYGGYVGAKNYGYIIRNNSVVEFVEGMECVPLE